MEFITRFAPSPTGPLHLGHAYSALLAHDMAVSQDGTFLLRIEDIDQSRARPRWEAALIDDLAWLGLHWPRPVMRQSERFPAYRAALQRLWEADLLFACTCNRRDIIEATSAPQEGSRRSGPDGPIYPGTCRAHNVREMGGTLPSDCALRLNINKSVQSIDMDDFMFCESGLVPNAQKIAFTAQDLIEGVGDVVLARRDMGCSYHLSVTLDDAAQQVTHVVRGRDLLDATRIHVLLQRLLDLPTPVYHHHRLIRDETGKRLAKRDDARAIALWRTEGKSPADIRAMVGL